ncbi:hypothetical protein [Janibacter sp. GXQ6167]|uniref:hypothetical protein n=1 Tax=Janibacter sp. GXQ6167 TaxID=3240791 RepID=UPI003526B1F0
MTQNPPPLQPAEGVRRDRRFGPVAVIIALVAVIGLILLALTGVTAAIIINQSRATPSDPSTVGTPSDFPSSTEPLHIYRGPATPQRIGDLEYSITSVRAGVPKVLTSQDGERTVYTADVELTVTNLGGDSALVPADRFRLLAEGGTSPLPREDPIPIFHGEGYFADPIAAHSSATGLVGVDLPEQSTPLGAVVILDDNGAAHTFDLTP